MNFEKYLFYFFIFSGFTGYSQNDFIKGRKFLIKASFLDSCIHNTSDVRIKYTIINTYAKPILVNARSIIFKMDIINENDDKVLIPDYKIAHSRDRAELECYLINPNDTVSFISVAQQFFYYSLGKNSKYKCQITYFNSHKKYFGNIKKFKGFPLVQDKIELNKLDLKTCL